MRKEKRNCFRFTSARVLGAALVAVSIINLIVVGAVFSAAPFSPFLSATAVMITPLPLTKSFTPTETLTPTATQTPTSTATQTPSITLTDTPTPTVCMLPVGWVIYIVRPGDNLFRIGLATGASAAQLKLANCLISDQIFPGQPLYVPRLPIYTPTPSMTPTNTPSATPTNTPSATSTGTSTFTYTPETPILLFGFGNDTGALQLPGTAKSFAVGER